MARREPSTVFHHLTSSCCNFNSLWIAAFTLTCVYSMRWSNHLLPFQMKVMSWTKLSRFQNKSSFCLPLPMLWIPGIPNLFAGNLFFYFQKSFIHPTYWCRIFWLSTVSHKMENQKKKEASAHRPTITVEPWWPSQRKSHLLQLFRHRSHRLHLEQLVFTPCFYLTFEGSKTAIKTSVWGYWSDY